MFCYLFRFVAGTFSQLGRYGAAVALVACLGLSGGCQSSNLRGDNFQDDSLASQARQMRPHDRNNELFGVTNKAQQIEKDVGVQ